MSESADYIECYQLIAELVSGAIDEPWADIHIEAQLDGNSVDIVVDYAPKHARRAPDTRKKVRDVPGIGPYFYQLARLVSREEKGLYKKCVFHLLDTGEYNVDFEY